MGCGTSSIDSELPKVSFKPAVEVPLTEEQKQFKLDFEERMGEGACIHSSNVARCMELKDIVDATLDNGTPEEGKAFMRSEKGAGYFAEMFFHMFDKNGDNVLDKEEFASCLRSYGRQFNITYN